MLVVAFGLAVRSVRRRVRAAGAALGTAEQVNLSRYVNEALRDKVRNEHARKLIEEYEAEHGPISEELLAEAEAEFRAAEAGWEEWCNG